MKQTIRTLIFMAAAFGLSSCGSTIVSQQVTEPGRLTVASKTPSEAMLPKYDVQAVRVAVPGTLRVSEANMYYPLADIVWRGDPIGDRYAQVKALMEEGLARGVQGLHSGPQAIVDVQLTRFHSLTEKTRFTFGGVHSVKFILTVRDAATGAVLEGPRPVVADVKASGGTRALHEDMVGRTMKVVITEHLAEVIRRELSTRIEGPAHGPATGLVSQAATPAVATVAALAD